MTEENEIPYSAVRSEASPEAHEAHRAHIESVIKESPRGMAIVTAALLEETLQQLMSARYPLFGERKLFRVRSPLGGYFEKWEIAYSVGIISEHERVAIELVGQIRNKFAHPKTIGLSFESDAIKDLVDQLAQSGILDDSITTQITTSAPEFVFTFVTTRLIGALSSRVEDIAWEARRLDAVAESRKKSATQESEVSRSGATDAAP